MTNRTRMGAGTTGRLRRRGRAIVPVLVVLSILCAIAAGAASGSASKLAPGDLKLAADQPLLVETYVSTTKSLLGQLAQSDPALVSRADANPVNVVVKLDYDSVASYGGNVSGYAATSPRRTGKKLKQNRQAVDAYSSFIAGVEAKVVSGIRARVPSASIRGSFRTVYGGVAATLPANQVKELLKVDGVVAVQSDVLLQPTTDATPAFTGADQVWPALGGSTKAGEGVIVGVIDTGIWPEHPSFTDNGISAPAGGPFGCELGTSGQPDDASFSCNDKLVGAYAFTDTYLSLIDALPGEFCDNATNTCSARDADGHGTHTASTAAGSAVSDAELLGVDRGDLSGMAPGAHVIAYRVCLDQGCFGSDSVAAVNQAIADGVDVINFSISGGSSAYTDPVELAFLDAYAAGISVNASAGNNGPAAATANHAGPWVTTVGASTSDRHFFSTLNLKAANNDTLALQGVTVTAGISAATDVVVNTVDPLCLNPAAPGTFLGKVVVCERGTNARVDKGYNVLQGGAAGMILYNPAVQQLNSDNHWLPAIHLEGPKTGTTGDAAKLVTFLSTHTGVTATWVSGTATPTQGDVMASFSSRGPLGDFIKPDVTAPGVQILAGMTPDPFDGNITSGPRGELFQAIAGTSMSSPHSAGLSALVKAAHPDWTPGQVKSALMTSSTQEVLKEDGTTDATPFDRGSGSIRANLAVNPTVTFDVGPLEYVTSAGEPLGRIDLNLPSVNAPTMSGEITTWRTMRNVTGTAQVLDVSTEASSGAEIIVAKARRGGKPATRSDARISVPAKGEVTFQVTIKAPTLANGQYFGQITLDPQAGGQSTVVLPVAFKKQQGAVSLKHICTPTSFKRATRGGKTTCNVYAENFAASAANVKVEVKPGKGLEYANATAPATLTNKKLVSWSGTLAAVEPPNVAVAPGLSPAGYLPLSAFGVAPIGGVTDDSLTNFTVPTFSFGGEIWNRVGVSSNGYVVIGGGSGADNTFLNQNLPNPTAPNNVVSPFWTDFNPPAGGALRIATLGDGTDTWIVIDWEAVKEFSTAATNSFQVWIGTTSGSPAEDVSMTYGTLNGSGDGGLLSVGAENKAGNRGQTVFFNGTGTLPTSTTELVVSSTPSAPGGSVSFNYDASAKSLGTFTTTANLTSNLTQGITQEQVQLTTIP